MLMNLAALLFAGLFGMVPPALALALDFETEARLKMALQIAREHNDEVLVNQVKKAVESVQSTTDPTEQESLLREVETSVGIDPGGWSMAGQPLFHPSPELMKRSRVIGPKLNAALLTESVDEVGKVVAEWSAILGEQAGLPDGRRPGDRPGSLRLDEAAATGLFVEALRSEGRAVKQLTAGSPLPDQMVRFYGYVLDGLATIRPSLQDHATDDREAADALARGVAKVLLTLQQPDGFFPFPDLRGKNIRFGEMIEKRLAAGQAAVHDGWVVTADADGGTQFDTGICGVALLHAGETFNDPAWIAAGLRAADWAMRQRCVANFNYNAFSVSLLARAYKVNSNSQYLDAALAKFRLGVAPGQAANGRWIDSHNARTVYHVIILRAIGDLLNALPDERAENTAGVRSVAEPALTAILTEFEAMGITVECLPELISLQASFPEHAGLAAAINQVAASLVEKCTDGTRVRMGAQPHQLAAVAAMLRNR